MIDDIKKVLGKLSKIAEKEEQKPADITKSTDVAKFSTQHPFKGKLVGEGSLLKELQEEINSTPDLERSLMEEYEQFKDLEETIEKVGSQYELKSSKGKNLGKFPTKAKAKKHEREVQYFKHKDDMNEGSEFGAYYYEELAREIHDLYPDLPTSGRADQLIDRGHAIAAKALGKQKADYIFYRDEDFASDFVSAYAHLQSQATDPVTESSEEGDEYAYRLLGRLKSDCEYFLGAGNRSARNLWAGSVADQIDKMKELWYRLPDDAKPEWLSMEDIDNYEDAMTESLPINESVALKFHTIKLTSLKQINEYAIKFFEHNEINKHYHGFANNIKHFANRKIMESASPNEIAPFIKLINTVDTPGTIKVGDNFAVLSFEVMFASNQINASGFTTPKKVKDIKLASDGTINYIRFEDGQRFPRMTPAVYAGRPVDYSAYFDTAQTANTALTALTLAVPDGWDFNSDDINSNQPDNGIAEGWGAEPAAASHNAQQDEWDTLLAKYENNPKILNRLKHLRSWKAKYAEEAALAGEYVVRGRAHKFPSDSVSEAKSKVAPGDWDVYDVKDDKTHSTHGSHRKAINKMNKLNKEHPGYETPGNIIASKFGARVSKLKESIRLLKESVDPAEAAVLTAVQDLISQGHTDVDPHVVTNMVVSATGKPFLLKDLVALNNNSPAIQQYIDSINPSKIKFSTDILTAKNEDPNKAKEQAERTVLGMADRAANKNRLVSESDDKPRLRLFKTISNGDKVAKVYKDLDWNEYRTKFFTNGVYDVDADSHTDDKSDALDTANYWVNKQVNEVSNKTLRSYVEKSFDHGNKLHKEIDATSNPKKKEELKQKLNKRNTGIEKAVPKISDLYEATADYDWNGWTIRYQSDAKRGQTVQWMAYLTKRGPADAIKGKSLDVNAAIKDAQAAISAKGKSSESISTSVAVNFNKAFRNEVLNGESDFAAKIIPGPALVIHADATPGNGFKRGFVKLKGANTKDGNTEAGNVMISISASEANSAELTAHGRYVLGDSSTDAEGNLQFPLIYRSTAADKLDREYVNQPMITVSPDRQ